MRWCTTFGTLCALLGQACETSPDQEQPEPAAARVEAANAHATSTNAEASTNAPTAAAQPQPAPPALAAGQQVQLHGWTELGSPPNTPHRSHAHETFATRMEVPPFAIDRLPYPNDPALTPKTGVTRDEAAALCADRGQRLCNEVEWEFACKTASGHPYPTGTSLDVKTCQKTPSSCGNALGVQALGLMGREWTSSHVEEGLDNALRTAVTRGAEKDAPAHAHRCAARDGATPDSKGDDLTFRCCSGPAPELTYPKHAHRPLVAKLDAPLEKLQEALRSDPRLAPLAASFKPFSAADISRALARGDRSRGSITAWHIADPVFAWGPQRGQNVWIISGRSGERSLVAALYPLPDGSFIHAASTIVDEPDMSIALGYTDDKPTELLWTTCYGCPGEGGHLAVGEDGMLRFSYW